MQTPPLISICIPVYKNVTFLQRLLQSLQEQTFTNFEVVITDDSPDEAIADWLKIHFNDARLRYFKNPLPLGTPENWNQAIRQATGQWIKLMHDDDWFAHADALQQFFDATVGNVAQFYFSNYCNVNVDDTSQAQSFSLPLWRWKHVEKAPHILYARNLIGAPSVTMVSRDVVERYDGNMKWLVDIDYYIRVLLRAKAHHIPAALVNVGQSQQQVTQYTNNNPSVEVPEALRLLHKLPGKPFRQWQYFDAWWRLLRNLNITTTQQLRRYSLNASIAREIECMMSFQKRVPKFTLRLGFCS
ncbi:MAG: glycosyltransferase family 2 protein, partial [Bacteroidetes bacterium]